MNVRRAKIFVMLMAQPPPYEKEYTFTDHLSFSNHFCKSACNHSQGAIEKMKKIVTSRRCRRGVCCFLIAILSSAIAATLISRDHSTYRIRTLQFRVSKLSGSDDQFRFSVIRNDNGPFYDNRSFDYSGAFKNKWQQFYLQSSLLQMPTSLAKIPQNGEPVSGLLIADPCIITSVTWMAWMHTNFMVPCTHGNLFQTKSRTPRVINGITKDVDFWGIIGDNFYDRWGDITASFFDLLSNHTMLTLSMHLPGNHDYWIKGKPTLSSTSDQYGIGFNQWYAMGTPSFYPMKTNSCDTCTPSIEETGFYTQVGNLGMIGITSYHSVYEVRSFAREACNWVGSKRTSIRSILLMGHWDVDNFGAQNGTATPDIARYLASINGCRQFAPDNIKYVMGHRHCNEPYSFDPTNGFVVGGQGMWSKSCSPQYGFTVFDSGVHNLRVIHFDMSTHDSYEKIIDCIERMTWRGCIALAHLWLNQSF